TFICLLVGILPSLTIGPWLETAVRSVLGPLTPSYSLALWHGVSEPLVMSLIALTGGTVLYLATARPLAAGPEGPPILHRIRAQRIYDRVMLAGTWVWPRALYEFLGTRRLQPQIRLLVLIAFAAAFVILAAAPGSVLGLGADLARPNFTF